MKTLILVLITCSFIQSTVVPIDLVLIILICRSYLRPDRTNLFLAFGFGLLDSHLNLNLIGLSSLIYLILVAVTESLSNTGLAGNSLLIIPLTLILGGVNQTVLSFFIHTSPQFFPKVLWEAILSLPLLYLVRLWEERFIVRKEIKLRV